MDNLNRWAIVSNCLAYNVTFLATGSFHILLSRLSCWDVKLGNCPPVLSTKSVSGELSLPYFAYNIPCERPHFKCRLLLMGFGSGPISSLLNSTFIITPPFLSPPSLSLAQFFFFFLISFCCRLL